MTDLSGSRGEANFVWRCKNCKRESSATIKAAPVNYEGGDVPKAKNIIEIDTRGLEFTEFRADVSIRSYCFSGHEAHEGNRESGKLLGRIQARNSRA
jgi:hypothetical protein